MRPEDIPALVEVGDPRLSPDGTTVVFAVTTTDVQANEYRGRIWVVPADGSSDARPLTPEGGRHSRPRWSPDGSVVAFVAVEEITEGEHRFSVCTVAPTGGAYVQVAECSDDIDDLAWSPDGRTIAFLAREREEERYSHKKAKDQPPRRITHLFSRLDNVGWLVDRQRHVFVVPADGSAKPRPMTEGPFEDGGLSWSPDGRRLAFTSARHDDWDLSRAVDIFIADVESGDEGPSTPRRLTETKLAHYSPSWSPDGTRIAVLVADEETAPRHLHLGVLDASSGALTVLTEELDRNCAPHGAHREPLWDGDHLWFTAEDAGNVLLYRVNAGGGPAEVVQGGDGWVTGFDVVAGTLAFTGTTPTMVSDLFVRATDGGDREVRRLTRFSDDFAAAVSLVEPQRFTVVSTGGAEVEAWIMPPADAEPGQRYPTLLNIHGGPFTQYGNRFFDEFQLQAGAGYAVVYSNPRGSSGYSEAWGRAIRWPECDLDPGSGWGGVDHDDVLAVIDEAVRRFDFVDGERLGVLGGSYGGFMTSWIAAKGGEQRFKAGVSERAVNDVLHLEHDSDIAGVFREYVGVSHVEDPEPYRRQSPITYVKDIVMPLLILHSENDLRCPISQAEELFVALRMLRRDVEFVRFPGEGHELSRSGSPRHRVQRAETILEYFGRRLAT